MHLARILTFKSRVALCCAALLIFAAVRLNADNIAFMGTVSGQFGTIDLKTGVFTVLGNSARPLPVWQWPTPRFTRPLTTHRPALCIR
jgi:hypothetical protein